MYCLAKRTKKNCFGLTTERKYLVTIDEVQQAIRIIDEAQSRARRLVNISVQPYKGTRYNPEKVRWVVEG